MQWLKYVLDSFKAQDMCDKTVARSIFLLKFVPDWFVTQQQVKLWHDYCDIDRLIEWYDGYKKREAQKEKIKEECPLLGIHQDGGIAVSLKTRKIVGINMGLLCLVTG